MTSVGTLGNISDMCGKEGEMGKAMTSLEMMLARRPRPRNIKMKNWDIEKIMDGKFMVRLGVSLISRF